jgi:hypothetical protein
MRLPKGLARPQGKKSTPSQVVFEQYQCSVRIDYVSASPFPVLGRRGFYETVFIWNGLVLSQSTFRTPTAVGNSGFDRSIESRSIDSSLAAGNDLSQSAVSSQRNG